MRKFRILSDGDNFYAEEMKYRWFFWYWKRMGCVLWNGVIHHNRFSSVDEAEKHIERILRKREGLKVIKEWTIASPSQCERENERRLRCT